MPISDPGNAGTAPRLVANTSAELSAMRKQRANALAMSILTGFAILTGGLGALFIDPWWRVLAIVAIVWVGVGWIIAGINHARFGPTSKSTR